MLMVKCDNLKIR